MKNVLAAAAAILCAFAIVTHAGDEPKKPKKEKDEKEKSEQSSNHKGGTAALVAKYDTNKDGKLNEAEKAAMSPEDKDKLPKGKGLSAEHKKKNKDAGKKAAGTNASPATLPVPASAPTPGVPATPATPAAPAAPATK